MFSFVGMETRVIPFEDIPKTGEWVVKMKVNREELSEVVVTGMFNRRKEGFTGSAVTVKGEELKKISTTNIAKGLGGHRSEFSCHGGYRKRIQFRIVCPICGCGTSYFAGRLMRGLPPMWSLCRENTPLIPINPY